jgi:hypothetical protein
MDPTFWVALFGFLGLAVKSVLDYKAQQNQKQKTEQIHELVNSKDDAQSKIIKELTAKVEELHRAALAKAEASPAVPPPEK